MTDLELLRIGSDETGTRGVLRIGQLPFAVTLELPWKDNQPNESCIPAGTYTCKRVDSPHFGNTFEITGVPGRTHVLFHKGNKVSDVKGCVAVAEKFSGELVAESKEGYDELMAKFAGRDSFELSVLDVNRYLPTI